MTSKGNRTPGRLLGLDVGDKRIGVAVSDPLGILATPLTIIYHTNWRQDIERVLAIAHQENVVGIVVGVPYYLDGTPSPQTHKVLRFIKRLRDRTPLPVFEWDETLSTEEAEARLRAAGRRRRQEAVDAHAAAVILQEFLEAHRPPPTGRNMPPKPELTRASGENNDEKT